MNKTNEIVRLRDEAKERRIIRDLSGVRFAEPADIFEIADLYRDSFPEHIMVHRGLLNNPQYILSRLGNPDDIWAVNDSGEEVCGVAALAIIPPVGLGEIERVCVSRHHRGKQIATRIGGFLLDQARDLDLGFVEAYARGDQPGMQRACEKLGFNVYGISPRFEVMHGDRIVREQFVHMGIELKPETIDESTMCLIPKAAELKKRIEDLKPLITDHTGNLIDPKYGI